MKCDEIFAALALLEKERGISPTFMTTRAWRTSLWTWTR